MATHANFLVDQGAKFTTVVTVTNDDGTLFDLTNYTPQAQMRKSYYTNTFTNITVAVEGVATNGNVRITISPTVSNGLKAGRYVYDVELHHNSDTEDVRRIIQGIITISPNVTRA